MPKGPELFDGRCAPTESAHQVLAEPAVRARSVTDRVALADVLHRDDGVCHRSNDVGEGFFRPPEIEDSGDEKHDYYGQRYGKRREVNRVLAAKDRPAETVDH